MREGALAPFGANGWIVESDETFIGNEPGKIKKRGYDHKRKVLSLIDRTSSCARSMVVDSVSAKTVVPILRGNIDREARIMTDDAGQYHYLKNYFSKHDVVHHSLGEYVSFWDCEIHTNIAATAIPSLRAHTVCV